ncbi:uncharacterized protein HLK63_M06171 [Nakaseomyces glabratus]|nr:uncharacterized protein GW608_M06171 [Nakaseomyces glabratus]UCS28844.1 uncharacterized protein HLK63_M06171 [Nakaseomyces glabratus]UCS34073.1 uncharacterized protein HLK64_M06171 [Nakaseomyces glabratus]UCS39303.1 uncharacterized protein HLK62_M06171 [Nakaseomyces glabratus]
MMMLNRLKCLGKGPLRYYSVHSDTAGATKTILDLQRKYVERKPLTMCTAYDFITASWVQKADTDILLIGDSMGMTSLGYDSTSSLTLDEFKYHVKSVCRAEGPSFIVSDMPFGSFETSISQGIQTAIDLMRSSSKVKSMKIESGSCHSDHHTYKLIGELCSRGIPVMGHIGLTPQRQHSLGGFKVQANKSVQEIHDLLASAKKLEELGCWGIVLECIPQRVAGFITKALSIPTIGIGAGNQTSGQVLVVSDLLGFLDSTPPKFVKEYDNLGQRAIDSIKAYNSDVTTKAFPETGKHNFKIKEDIWNQFLSEVKVDKT